MPDIRQYILSATRTYHYRLRTIVPIDDAALSKIETALLKYDPIDMTMPRKTIFQDSPLDFPNVKNHEVYILDFETAYPAKSKELIEREIADALDTFREYVVVRTPNDPTELETERLNALRDIEAAAEKADLKPESLLVTAQDYPEAPEVDTADLYGDAYNKKFLSYIAKVEAEKKEARKAEAPNPLFSWLDQPKPEAAAEDFNADIDGVVKPVSTGTDPVDGGPDRSAYGNFDGVGAKLRRVYKSMKGADTVLTSKGE
jgi:hypothetical protein